MITDSQFTMLLVVGFWMGLLCAFIPKRNFHIFVYAAIVVTVTLFNLAIHFGDKPWISGV